jgi:ligand-binding SRPBCC domain-containing protein
MATITRASSLAAAAPEVWRHATSLDGINRELAPWMTMSAPPELRGLSLDDDRVVIGERLFVSWVRLFGVVPLDRMEVTIVELERGRRFVEQSPMLAMRRWRHERTVEPAGAGCVLRDTLTFSPGVARPALAAFFAHRHRVLARLFGQLPVASGEPARP